MSTPTSAPDGPSQDLSRRPGSAPSALTTLAATLLAFLVVGVVDFATLGGRGATGEMLGIVLGLDLLVGLLVGALLAAVIPATVMVLRPGEYLRAYVWPKTARETSAEALNSATAWWFAAMGAAVVVAIVAGLAGHVAHGFNQKAFVLPFTALGAFAGLGAGAGALFLFRRVGLWKLRFFAPRGFMLGLPTPAFPLITLLLLDIAVDVWLSTLDLGAYKIGGYVAIVSGAFGALVLTWLLNKRPSRIFALISLAFAIGLGGWSILAFDEAKVAQTAVPLDGHSSRLAVSALRTLLDADNDGYSAMMAGGDCDDHNPKIGPHAKEIPGNGIDDNCQGGDAPKEELKPPPPPPPPKKVEDRWKPQRWNLLFILVDTLRPDHLGLHGYERATSPNIDAWAKDAVVFERVFAQAPNTPRSVPSLLTGRYPSRVKWTKRFKSFSGMRPENETLFEIFQAGGWHTEAQTAHWYFERAKGIKDGVDNWDNRGFLTIKESNTQSAAPKLTPRVVGRLETLSKEKKPFVLFAHYFEPHSRYMNHKSVKVFGKKLMDKYDSEIAFTDHHLQPVFDALQRTGLYENTVVVLTSDHGEAFKEHGFHFHGRTLYDEEIRVPLLIRAPGMAHKRVKHAVGLVDLLPTLTAIVGLKAPKAQGQSLLPLLTGKGKVAQVPVFMEQLPYPMYKVHVKAAVSPKGVKVVKDLTKNVTEVFDLNTDPAEKKNLLQKDPQAAEALRKKLSAFIDTDPGE